LVQTKFEYTRQRSTAVIDLTFGPNAELGNFGNSGTATAIKQAYFSYNLTDKLSLSAGQYGTHIGYELIDAPVNFNYSLSYLFGNGPFYHTGIKMDYAVNDKLSLMMGIVNGWDALLDFNTKKSLTLQVGTSPIDGLNLYLNWIGGDEYNGLSAFGNSEGSFTSLFDLTGSYETMADSSGRRMLIGINAAYGQFFTGFDGENPTEPHDNDAIWGGAALYLNYYFQDNFGLGVRAEYFDDKDGVRYFGPLSVFGLTISSNIRLGGDQLLIIPEIRIDQANDPFFETNDTPQKTQTTIGLSLVYQINHELTTPIKDIISNVKEPNSKQKKKDQPMDRDDPNYEESNEW